MTKLSVKKASFMIESLRTHIDTNVRPNVLKMDVFRKKVLQSIAEYLVSKNNTEDGAKLLFICTHNSRRSHLSQVWAQTAAYYFGLENILCYSGGTEVTAFYPSAVAALASVGFKIEKNDKLNKNPNYTLMFSDDTIPIVAFSKLYNSQHNPTSDFCAVMTCSGAEKNCPIVNGADRRFALHYEDPKLSDGTMFQKQVYAERSLQIATEMFYLMGQVARKPRS